MNVDIIKTKMLCGKEKRIMRNEFTAIIERDGDWYIAYCPEIPGANGQGNTIPESLHSLAEAISLILEDRREDALRGMPSDAVREVVIVE
jgi:predicted RNase H-like HicB family nuclease